MTHFNDAISESDFGGMTPAPETTHYITAYTDQIGHLQRAACGSLVEPRVHSCEPSCDECRAFVLADSKETAESRFGAEDPTRRFDPIPDVKQEFEQAMNRRFVGGRR